MYSWKLLVDPWAPHKIRRTNDHDEHMFDKNLLLTCAHHAAGGIDEGADAFLGRRCSVSQHWCTVAVHSKMPHLDDTNLHMRFHLSRHNSRTQSPHSQSQQDLEMYRGQRGWCLLSIGLKKFWYKKSFDIKLWSTVGAEDGGIADTDGDWDTVIEGEELSRPFEFSAGSTIPSVMPIDIRRSTQWSPTPKAGGSGAIWVSFLPVRLQYHWHIILQISTFWWLIDNSLYRDTLENSSSAFYSTEYSIFGF
jgi:hypothetical protein